MDEWIEWNFVKRKQTANGHNCFVFFLPLSPLLLATILGNLQIFPVPITQPRHDKTRPHLLENVRELCTTQNDGIHKII